jgi:hypothetical protein
MAYEATIQPPSPPRGRVSDKEADRLRKEAESWAGSERDETEAKLRKWALGISIASSGAVLLAGVKYLFSKK